MPGFRAMRGPTRVLRRTIRRTVIIGGILYVECSNGKKYKVEQDNGKQYYIDEDGQKNYMN